MLSWVRYQTVRSTFPCSVPPAYPFTLVQFTKNTALILVPVSMARFRCFTTCLSLALFSSSAVCLLVCWALPDAWEPYLLCHCCFSFWFICCWRLYVAAAELMFLHSVRYPPHKKKIIIIIIIIIIKYNGAFLLPWKSELGMTSYLYSTTSRKTSSGQISHCSHLLITMYYT